MTNIRGILGKVTQAEDLRSVGKTESWQGYNYPGLVMALDACYQSTDGRRLI
jgi:hypothetical protein